VTIAGPTGAVTMTVPNGSFTAARTDAANSFTGVQTMTSAALTTPVITTDIHSASVGGATLGNATLPFGAIYFAGQSGPYSIELTGTPTANRTVTFADGNTTLSTGTMLPTVTNVKTYMGGSENAPATQASATAGVACDFSLGSTCAVTLYGATSSAMAITMSNAVSGQVYRIVISDNGLTTGFIPTYSGYTIHWGAGTSHTAPTLTTGSHYDFITCHYSGTFSLMFCDVDPDF